MTSSQNTMSLAWADQFVENVTSSPWLDHEINSANLSSAAGRGTGDSTLWISETGFYVNFIAQAVIIPVGLVCNAFSIGVFVTAAKFRRTSTGQLLIALSAVDWLVLVGDGLRWLNKENNRKTYVTGLDFYDTSDFVCKFVNIWRYSMKLLSSWLTVVITLERLAAVAMPLKVGHLSTPFRMRCIVVILAVVCVSVSLFPAWTLASELLDDGYFCVYRLVTEDQYRGWLTAVRRVGTFAAPTLLLIICSSLIVYFLARAEHMRPQSTRGGSYVATARHHQQQRSPSKDKSKSTQRQLTIMLVAICAAYFVLQLPYMILYFINSRKLQLWPGDEYVVKRARVYAAMEMSEAASVANHAVNFFLYCVSGSAFRRHVRRTCGGGRASRRPDVTGSTWCPSTYRQSTSQNIRLQRRLRDDDNDKISSAE